MVELSIGWLWRPIWKLFTSTWERIKRPSFHLSRAPENVFEHLRPYTSVAKAREILGTPIREYTDRLLFKFTDAFVQVGIGDNNTITSVCLVIPKVTRRTTFKIFPLKFVLGKSSMADVFFDDSHNYEYDSSSKHFQLWAKQYYGMDGNYLHYAFGVLGAPNVKETEINLKIEEDLATFTVLSSPEKIIPNMAWASTEADFYPSFDFWGFN